MSTLRQSPLFQAMLLGAFALGAAAALASGNLATKDAIKQRLAEDLTASISQVIPADLHDNDLLADQIEVSGLAVYQARQGDAVEAVAFEVKGKGYTGDIVLIMGVKKDGSLLGVRVLAHAETPGLGDKIEIAKDPWITSFNGLSFEKLPKAKWKVKKDGGHFDQFSGATITPRGVVDAVRQGLAFFIENRQTMLTPKTREVKKGEGKS